MRIFAGPLRTGFTAILTALLLPVLGIGAANAQMSVGDTVMLKVPDLAAFPDPVETRQFTVRAVTEHAYWLVQDTVSVREGDGPGTLGNPVWDNLIDQDELDVLTAEFEGSGVNVYGTVTDYLGPVPSPNGDDKLWIVMATMRDQTTWGNNPIDRKIMEYVNPADLDGSGDFNNHDIIYINVHTYTENSTVLQIAKELRRYHIPNGLGVFIRTARKPTEEKWVIRGLGGVSQFLCYGLTATNIGGFGVKYDLDQFAIRPAIELIYYASETPNMDYAQTRGQSLLWLFYLAQREGYDILEAIAQSDTTCMMNIATAIDPSVPEDEAIETNVVPIYEDWLVCNLVNPFADDLAGGIYRYDILLDYPEYSFGHLGKYQAFEEHFGTGDYPFGIWIPDADKGVRAPAWAAQYVEFKGDYQEYPNVFFNGAYGDAQGSGSNIDGKWTAFVVWLDTTSETIAAVAEADLNELYNGSFSLGSEESYLIVTNNNPGGQSGLRYILSQDDSAPELLMAVHQNSVNDQYLKIYATLYGEVPEGFDWYGPICTATTGDSTVNIGMSEFYGTIWRRNFNAWTSGDYTLQTAGYDSSGFYAGSSKSIAVGYASSGKMILEVQAIRFEVPEGSVAPGTMVSLSESGVLDLALGTGSQLEDVVGMMTGVLSGPVTIPDVGGTLSFPAASPEGAVYRYTSQGWERLHSYYQGGRMCAAVSEGGSYAYGESPGVESPSIPAEFGFGGIYPNPFSAEAAIRFSLPSAGRVNVTIYDMSGRAVRTLTDTEMGAAEHTLVWDGLDQTGQPVGAGVFFCRLQAAGETLTQKMLRIE